MTLVIIVVSLALNALLACIEMAFVTVAKSDLRGLADQGNVDAKRLLSLRANPERTLSVLQIGITLVGAVSAAAGGAGAEESLSPYLMNRFALSEHSAEALSVALVVLPLTYFSVVVGELVPKTLALRSPLKLSLLSARWLVIFDKAFSPVVFFLEKSTQLALKLVPSFSSAPKPSAPSADESPENAIETLPRVQRQYVLNVIALNRRTAGQIALPWASVDKLHIDMPLDQVKSVVLASGHTRLPVYQEENLTVGILHTKEFMIFADTGGTDWTSLIRGALHVHPTDPVPEVLRLMQRTRNHMSLVIEASGTGAPLGIVTLEGIFEEVVGDIFDEDDDGRMRRVLLSNPRFKPFLNRR